MNLFTDKDCKKLNLNKTNGRLITAHKLESFTNSIIQSMNTFFKSHDSTQYFNYDHLSGIMLTIVQDGCHQGLFQRCDKNSLVLVRQYSKEMTQGLHESVRTYHPSDVNEFFRMYQKTLHNTQVSFNQLITQF